MTLFILYTSETLQQVLVYMERIQLDVSNFTWVPLWNISGFICKPYTENISFCKNDVRNQVACMYVFHKAKLTEVMKGEKLLEHIK